MFNAGKGVFLAILPFVGYLTAYNYEKGYLSFFNIPSFLIRLGPEEIIVATSVLILGLFTLYPFLAIIYPFRNLMGKSVKGRDLKIAIILFLFLSPIIFIFSNSSLSDKLIISLAIFLLLLFYKFGFPLLFFKGDSLDEKIVKAEKTEKKVGQIEDFIFSRPRLKTFYIVLLTIMFISLLAYSAGARDASNQREYLLFSDKDTYIIARTYTDKRIAVKIDAKSRFIKDNIRIISPADTLDLRLKTVGPLERGEKRNISVSLFGFAGNIVDQVLNFFKSILINIGQAIIRK